jgi:hypothetical protein
MKSLVLIVAFCLPLCGCAHMRELAAEQGWEMIDVSADDGNVRVELAGAEHRSGRRSRLDCCIMDGRNALSLHW